LFEALAAKSRGRLSLEKANERFRGHNELKKYKKKRKYKGRKVVDKVKEEGKEAKGQRKRDSDRDLVRGDGEKKERPNANRMLI